MSEFVLVCVAPQPSHGRGRRFEPCTAHQEFPRQGLGLTAKARSRMTDGTQLSVAG